MLQYWYKDEDKKQRLLEILDENERKYQEELREKYNPDDLFNKDNKIKKDSVANQNTSIIEYKDENSFKKLLNKIMKFLHINR